MIEGYSLICTMPKNAHESYIRAGRVLVNPFEEDNNKKIANKFIKKYEEAINKKK